MSLNPSCELALAYAFYSTPFYMYLAQAAGLEAVRRVICYIVTLAFAIAGKALNDETLGEDTFDNSDDIIAEESAVPLPRATVVSMWLFHLFLCASIVYDLVEYLPYTSTNPETMKLTSWQRMVRFSLWFANSHVVRNIIFYSMMTYSHMMRSDGILSRLNHDAGDDDDNAMKTTRVYFGNLNFGAAPASFTMPLASFHLPGILTRLGFLAFACAAIFMLILNILFLFPVSFVYIWFGLIWILCLAVLVGLLKLLSVAVPTLDHILPFHVIVSAVLWAQTCMCVEVMASFYRRGSYIGAINESFYCRDSYEIWKEAANGGLWVRIFF